MSYTVGSLLGANADSRCRCRISLTPAFYHDSQRPIYLLTLLRKRGIILRRWLNAHFVENSQRDVPGYRLTRREALQTA